MTDKLKLDGPLAAYLRVSTDQQDTVRQYDAIHAFEKRHGITIPPHLWFKDEGWARDKADKRPDFQRMLKLVERGQLRTLVVPEIHRFGTKDEFQLMHYLHLLREG